MPEPCDDASAEIARLRKIVGALMDRAERSTSVRDSAFTVFQTTVMLEGQVRRRTSQLEAALHENERITRELRASEAIFRGIADQSLVGIVLIDESGRFVYANATFGRMVAYGVDELVGMRPLDIVVDADKPLVAESLRKRLAGEIEHVEYVVRCRRKDGATVVVNLYGSRMDVDGRPLLITLALDITERSRIEGELRDLQAQLVEQSTHDALTGLYNRRHLEAALERELLVAGEAETPVSVIMGDLDHFKSINDRYGHLTGDEVLRTVGELLKGNARSSDTYARYGGEEFLLVLPGMPEPVASTRAERLRQLVAATPVRSGDDVLSVTVSFGVATYPQHGATADALIDTADQALYLAKAAGRDRVVTARAPLDEGAIAVTPRR